MRNSSDTENYTLTYFRSLNCPRSLTLSILFRYQEWDQIADMECNPVDYADAYSFRDAYQATSFLSKSDFLPLKRDRKQVAIEKFFASELKCGETNKRWSSRREFTHSDWHSISCLANKIYSILGPSPNYEEVIDSSSWGPGATLSVKSREASSFKKFRDERGITIDAYSSALVLKRFYPLLEDRIYSIEAGDKLVVVPKNCRTDRVILIQPGWNLWFQKGIGKVLRRKLYNSGLDLNSADKRNQLLARVASKTGHLCTVDFSSASDQIAIEPLRELLPPEWFKLLDHFRSKRSFDSVHHWNKFSSMGNGFTFELESLIFYAAALVACDLSNACIDEVSVFGDDVILPIESLSSFRKLCDLLGFTFNPSKSFYDGSFRESCGSHFYNGVDCKPIFLKRKISDIRSRMKLHNQIRRLAHRNNNYYGCDKRFIKICKIIQGSLPIRYRLKIPEGFGEVGLIANFDEATPSRMKRGFEGYSFRALIDIPIKRETEESSLLLVRLTEHSDLPRHNTYEVKSRTRQLITRLSCHEWYDFGPWI